MKNQHHKPFGLIVTMSTLMLAHFLFSPPFERNPQQCEMVKTIGKRKQIDTEDEPGPE